MVTELITDTLQHGVVADGYWVSGDLRYSIVTGSHPESGSSGHWLYDLDTGSMTALDALTGHEVKSPYFLDDDTLVFREYQPDGSFQVIRWHIPTGTGTMLLESVTDGSYRPVQYHWADGRHALLFREDGSVELMNFQTGEIMKLTGLSPENLICDESPDGSRIMLGCEENDSFTSLGILDLETGVLKLLDREVSGSESFRGWLDNDTLVITAHDAPNADLHFTPGDGYYVYVYRFQSPAD